MQTIQSPNAIEFGTAQDNGSGLTAKSHAAALRAKTRARSQRHHAKQERIGHSVDSTCTPVGPIFADWDDAFKVWHDCAPGRSKASARAAATPWNELRLIAMEEGVDATCGVTPDLVRKFVSRMVSRDLSAAVVNVRLSKIKSIFNMLAIFGVVNANPAKDVHSPRVSTFAKQKARRLAFYEPELTAFFSSPLFSERQLRAGPIIGEASYWIPILQFYTGARAEELAILTLSDVVMDPEFGWHFKLGSPACSDVDLVAARGNSAARHYGMEPYDGERVRRVPIAPQLFDLGFGRYMDWRREQGHQLLFPELVKDWSGRSTGALAKFFKRYKENILGFDSPVQVLRCLPWSMRVAMVRSNTSIDFVRSILGLAPEKSMTMLKFGYPELPLAALTEEFKRIEFLPIPVHPWMPGKGVYKHSAPSAATQ